MREEVGAQTLDEFDEATDLLDRARVQQRDLALGGVDERLVEAAAGVLRMHGDTGLGSIADAASGGVEDASQAHRVVGVGDHPQVGDHVPDLFALIELGAADHLVRDAVADEHLLDRTGAGVGAVEDRDVGVLVARRPADRVVGQFLDLLGDERRLLTIGVGDVADDEFAVTGVGPQLLLATAGVARDDRVGSRQDGLRRTVVLFEQNGFGVGEVALELFDVADGGAAEGVDRLIGVTDDAEFGGFEAARGGLLPHQFADEDVLGVVGVLVLVDEDVPEAAPVVLGDLRVTVQQGDGLADQVVEVEGVGRPQPALVLAEDLRDRRRGEVVLVCRGRRLVGRDQLVLEVRDRHRDTARTELLRVQVEVADDHAQQPLRVVGVVDGEVGVHPLQQPRLRPQDADARRVEGRDPHVGGPGSDQVDDALAHLGGGFVGEGDGQDLPGRDVPRRQQVGDAAGEDRGLARPRAGDDQQRCARVEHRGALLRVEALEQAGDAVVGGNRPRGGGRRATGEERGRRRAVHR